MPTVVPKEPVVAALGEVWARLDELLAGLDDDEWATPTCLPGLGRQGRRRPRHRHRVDAPRRRRRRPWRSTARHRAHVRNDIGRFNEAWVVAVADE